MTNLRKLTNSCISGVLYRQVELCGIRALPDMKTKFPGMISFILLVVVLLMQQACAAKTARNPFGVMVGGDEMSTQSRIDVAKDLGAAYFRPWGINIEEWKGHHKDTESIQKAGFKILLTVRSTSKGASGRYDYDINEYKKSLAEILDKYHPELLVIETGENSALYYSSAHRYSTTMLKAAASVAHARGIKCTNGGLASSLVTALVWNNYRVHGNHAKADDFAERACTPQQLQIFRSSKGREKIKEAIKKGNELLAAYKSVGINYINFHWYADDPEALEEVIAFLKSETGLQPITNEIGQENDSANTVNQLMSKIVEMKIPYAIWSSVDRPDCKALQNPDGSLRSSGDAFKAFIGKKL